MKGASENCRRYAYHASVHIPTYLVYVGYLCLSELFLDEDATALQAVSDGDESLVLLLRSQGLSLQALYLDVVVPAAKERRESCSRCVHTPANPGALGPLRVVLVFLVP